MAPTPDVPTHSTGAPRTCPAPPTDAPTVCAPCTSSSSGGRQPESTLRFYDPNKFWEPASALPTCDSREFWTDPPDDRLVAKGDLVEALLREAKQLPNKGPDGGKLLRFLGKKLEEISGTHDPSFFQTLPPARTKVVVLQALCGKYGKTLLDGDATISGALVDCLERALGVHIIRTNITRCCQRKGKDGVEPKNGGAGCVDPTGERLKVLAMVKELHFLGLLAAGLDIVAIIASANASILSFANLVTGKHFVQQQGEGVYKNTPFFTAPHLKYVSPRCIFISAVATCLGVALGDPLAVTSRMVEGWSRIAAQIGQLARGLELLEGESLEAAMRPIYEALCTDPKSPAVARAWDDRRTTKTSPATQAKLEKVLAERCRLGGAPPHTTHHPPPSATSPSRPLSKRHRCVRRHKLPPRLARWYRNGPARQPRGVRPLIVGSMERAPHRTCGWIRGAPRLLHVHHALSTLSCTVAGLRRRRWRCSA